MSDFYQLLGVAPDATHDQIHDAYRTRLKVCHPDHHQGATAKELAQAATATTDLNEAWEAVGDPTRRTEYDRSRAGRAPTGGGVGRRSPGQGWRPGTGAAGPPPSPPVSAVGPDGLLATLCRHCGHEGRIPHFDRFWTCPHCNSLQLNHTFIRGTPTYGPESPDFTAPSSHRFSGIGPVAYDGYGSYGRLGPRRGMSLFRASGRLRPYGGRTTNSWGMSGPAGCVEGPMRWLVAAVLIAFLLGLGYVLVFGFAIGGQGYSR